MEPSEYYEVMELLRSHEAFDYMSELHATDFVTHMEVYVHLFSYGKKQSVAVKVKLDREAPQVESVTALWKGRTGQSGKRMICSVLYLRDIRIYRVF